MTTTSIAWLGAVPLALAASAVLTGLIRRRAIQHGVLDHPNERSSHTAPMPRGGGFGIVAVTLTFLLVAGISGLLAPRHALSLFAGGLIVALAGWIDDVGRLPPRPRLAAHFLAATLAVVGSGGFQAIDLGSNTATLGWIGTGIAIIGITWSINFFNFMDGIDGIAGAEAVAITAVGGALLWTSGNHGLAMLCFVLAASSLGFLHWNWEPARIFMGDIGSGFIGFMIAAIALLSESTGHVPVLIWAILGSVFILDATVTLLRLLPDKPWSEAHRLHAYQRAASAGWSHSRISASVLLIDVVLGALATYAFFLRQALVPMTALAFLLVAVVYYAVERVSPLREAKRSRTWPRAEP